MKTYYKLALAVLAGFMIGVAGARAIHAQQGKTPPAYVIAEVEVTDPTSLKKYSDKAPQMVASFNGHYVVRGGGNIQSLEGEPPKGFIVVIGFESAEKARDWYDSGKAQRRADYLSPKASPPSDVTGQVAVG